MHVGAHSCAPLQIFLRPYGCFCAPTDVFYLYNLRWRRQIRISAETLFVGLEETLGFLQGNLFF
ncbi:MAG: hypothetical protein CLLPBCKN_001417 [Chroococcidiopsis cubana SAG 39.79]|jgi:hypothetical protein|nr:hypothetical protein [Chroococcidiopsis cubana SAG 39.79]